MRAERIWAALNEYRKDSAHALGAAEQDAADKKLISAFLDASAAPPNKTKRQIKLLCDAIPKGPRPQNPSDSFISVRLDIIEEVIDNLEWINKGLAEWREIALSAGAKQRAESARASIAIRHLHAVLNTARTNDEQQRADSAAREWLESIGSEVPR